MSSDEDKKKAEVAAEDFRKAQQAFADDLRKTVKEGLDQLDAHPIGHMVCEVVRARVRGELQDENRGRQAILDIILGKR